MKKYKTEDERVKAVAKTLVKEFKASKDNNNEIDIIGCFSDLSSNKFKGVHVVFRHGYKEEVDFGEISNPDLGSITCKIADAICAKLKVKKGEILYREERRNTVHHGTWYAGWDSHYTTTKRITLIRPCKGFFAINKKLKALGLSEISFKDWYRCNVFGKRSSIFGRDYHYYAESEKMCDKVLAYLKAKKKLSYEYVDEEDKTDQAYGERYETEWSGWESRELCFTDSKGHKTVIY